jgi:hypothetical protein
MMEGFKLALIYSVPVKHLEFVHHLRTFICSLLLQKYLTSNLALNETK